MYKVLLAFVLALATCGTVEAQYTPFRLPDHVTVYVDGVRHEAFNEDGFRALLRMDEDLRHYVTDHPLLQGRLDACLDEVEALLGLADLRLQDISTLTAENARLHAAWVEENRLRLEAQNAPDFMSWFGWGLATVFAVATVVLSAIIGGSGGI